ncbi:hypothetical protein EJB05_39587, partial [Eragrostis curvula]
MGKGNGARNVVKPGDELVDLIFSWSLQDVMNHDLFRDKANTIPDRFSGLKSYLDSFRVPLLEEMRAEMSSNLESLPNHSSTVPIQSLVPRGKGVKTSLHYGVTATDGYAFFVSLLCFITYVRVWRCLDHAAAVKRSPALVKVLAGDAPSTPLLDSLARADTDGSTGGADVAAMLAAFKLNDL